VAAGEGAKEATVTTTKAGEAAQASKPPATAEKPAAPAKPTPAKTGS